MDFVNCIMIFLAIVTTSLFVTNVVNTWVSILAVKDNFIDRYWMARFLYLLASAISITYLISNNIIF